MDPNDKKKIKDDISALPDSVRKKVSKKIFMDNDDPILKYLLSEEKENNVAVKKFTIKNR